MRAALTIGRPPAADAAVRAGEEAALRRLAALARAEAEELEPGCWLQELLDGDGGPAEWGDRLVSELGGLMSEAWEVDGWIGRSAALCPLDGAQEAALRRLAAQLRAEAAELGDASSLGRRLERWGIRIILECQRVEAPPRLG